MKKNFLNLIVIFHIVCSQLQVDIEASPNSETLVYEAGTSVTLICHVEGGYPPLTHQWSPNCSYCFTSGLTSATVSTHAVHGGDSGIHSCMVSDYVGHSGSSELSIQVVGECIIV